MRFLITGVAGFLGSALANRLVHEGHIVFGLDNLSTGNQKSLAPDVEFIQGDVNDRPKLWTLLQNVDCVYHLAARVLVPESVLYPREYNNVNVGGTVTLMEAIRDVGVSRVLFTSSGALYGNQENQPVNEDAIPRPRSPYAVSKLAAEYYIHTIGELWGIETVSLRLFNIYGPGQYIPPMHPPVIPNFLRQASQGGTLVVHGDGNQTRDYLYIEDAINALVSAIKAPGLKHSTINVGSGEETSVRELVRLVSDITGGHPEVMYNPRVDTGPDRLRADLTLARDKLNFQPTISLETGLRLTLEQDERLQDLSESV